LSSEKSVTFINTVLFLFSTWGGSLDATQSSENKLEQPQPRQKGAFKAKIKEIYRVHYKKLLLVTLIIVFLAILEVGLQFAITGDFFKKDISLKGGTSITVTLASPVEVTQIQDELSKQFPKADLDVRSLSATGTQIGIIVDATDVNETILLSSLKNILGAKGKDYSLDVMGSSLGQSFFKELIFAILAAFALMATVVFITFRTPVPSGYVVLCAFSDIIFTLAAVNLLGMRISTAGVAAFLMLIGYSVDTDILLTSNVLRRKEGTVLDRVLMGFKTGVTMDTTTIAAVTVGLIFSPSPVIQQIMTILLIGVCVDIPFTWIQNAGFLRLYLEKKEQRQKQGSSL